MEEGEKEKRKHLFGLHPHKSRPWALQRITQDPVDYFLISPSELSGTHLSSPPLFISCRHWQRLWQAVFHFLLCSCLAALCCQPKPSSAGKSHRRIRERPNQVSPRQAGIEGRGGVGWGTEVWGKGWERDWYGEGGKEGRPGVARERREGWLRLS